MHINKHGLSRNIPSEKKRKIRKDCGFGCVVCGGAIYEYEHIEPEFAETKTHEVDKIALLCGNCHLKVTKGLWSKEKIWGHRKDPFCVRQGNSRYLMDISVKNKINIILGKCVFINTTNIIEIDNKVILKILPPEIKNTPPRIIANFFDQHGMEVASINKNEWIGNAAAFDIEFIGSEISIRSKKYEIDLKIKITHPNIINISRLNLKYNSCRICGDTKSGFKLKSKSTEIFFGKVDRTFQNVNYGMLIKGGGIYLSETRLFEFKTKNSTSGEVKSGYIKAVGDISVEVREKGDPNGQFKFTSTGPNKNSFVELQMPLDDPKRYSIKLNNTVQKNSKCLCGSSLNYEKCCRKNKGLINTFLKTKIISHCITDIVGRHELENVVFDIKYVKGEIPTKLFVSKKKELKLIFNSDNIPDLNRIGFSLMLFDCIKSNYHYYLDKIYSDKRQNFVNHLNEMLISIPVYDRLSRHGFDISDAFRNEFNFIMSFVKNPPPCEEYVNLNNLGYAFHLLRLSYNCDFLGKDEEKLIFDSYKKYFPIGYRLYEEILQLLLSHNVYHFKGFNECKLKILQLINPLLNINLDEALRQIEVHHNTFKDVKEKFKGMVFNKPDS